MEFQFAANHEHNYLHSHTHTHLESLSAGAVKITKWKFVWMSQWVSEHPIINGAGGQTHL